MHPQEIIHDAVQRALQTGDLTQTLAALYIAHTTVEALYIKQVHDSQNAPIHKEPTP